MLDACQATCVVRAYVLYQLYRPRHVSIFYLTASHNSSWVRHESVMCWLLIAAPLDCLVCHEVTESHVKISHVDDDVMERCEMTSRKDDVSTHEYDMLTFGDNTCCHGVESCTCAMHSRCVHVVVDCLYSIYKRLSYGAYAIFCLLLHLGAP